MAPSWRPPQESRQSPVWPMAKHEQARPLARFTVPIREPRDLKRTLTATISSPPHQTQQSLKQTRTTGSSLFRAWAWFWLLEGCNFLMRETMISLAEKCVKPRLKFFSSLCVLLEVGCLCKLCCVYVYLFFFFKGWAWHDSESVSFQLEDSST